MLFNSGEKKTHRWNNIAGAIPLGWWSGKWVALKIGGFAAEMGLQVLKGTLISLFHLVSVGGSTEKRSVMIQRLIILCDLHPKKR
jgi:hypothetical protein